MHDDGVLLVVVVVVQQQQQQHRQLNDVLRMKTPLSGKDDGNC